MPWPYLVTICRHGRTVEAPAATRSIADGIAAGSLADLLEAPQLGDFVRIDLHGHLVVRWDAELGVVLNRTAGSPPPEADAGGLKLVGVARLH